VGLAQASDGDGATVDNVVPRKVELSWSAVAAYVTVHLVCLGAIWTGIDRTSAIVFAVCYAVRLLGLTVAYHRYFSHRAFKTSRPMQLVLGVLGALTLQGGVIWWAETHRRHHRSADTPDDLHSPHYLGFLYAHFGWFLDKKHRATRLEAVPDLARFPELVWLDRWHFVPFAILAVGLYAAFGAGAMIWGAFIPTVILWEYTHWVQSMSHMLGGYRRWDSADRSRNHWLLGVLAFGEFHNNHHRFPSSAKQSCAWWEPDVGYWFLRALAALGLVWNVRVPHLNEDRDRDREGSEA
jgi:stearoyl-CoA desaturase (delta-9 desaturase)